MKLAEVRKLTLTFNSNKSLPVCGPGPSAWPFKFSSSWTNKTLCPFDFHISSVVARSKISLFLKKLLIPHLSLLMLTPVALSRRSDVEILGYCMLRWLCGKLPWEQNLKDPVAVQTAKTKYVFSNLFTAASLKGLTLWGAHIPEKIFICLTRTKTNLTSKKNFFFKTPNNEQK